MKNTKIEERLVFKKHFTLNNNNLISVQYSFLKYSEILDKYEVCMCLLNLKFVIYIHNNLV